MRGFTMPFSPETLEEKPYNICVTCPNIGQTCDGPNFLAITVERWCEWCHLRKDFLGWKNATLSEKSGVSRMSIDRIMAGDVKDLRITTMQAVTKALLNGSWGQSPCALVAETEKEINVDNPVIVAQCQHLQNTLDALVEDFKEEAQRKIDFLRGQIAFKERQMDAKDKQIELLHSIIAKQG
jgi:hypothetical protein